MLSGGELEEFDTLSFLVDEIVEKDRHQWPHQYAKMEAIEFKGI